MTSTVKTETLAIWLSRFLRFALGLLMLWLAYSYDDAQILYFVGALIFATGFLKPKRCIDGACDIPPK
jgi:hypothetical protein